MYGLKSQEYHSQLQNLVENSLLHLYCFISDYKAKNSVKFVKVDIRNKALSDYLKKQHKRPCYKLLNKDIKVLINSKKLGSIEKNLLGLYKPTVKNGTDVEHLFSLINRFETSGFKVDLFDPTNKQNPDTILVQRDDIERCFDDTDSQVEPLSLRIKTEKIDQIHSILHDQNHFKYDLLTSNTAEMSYHYKIFN